MEKILDESIDTRLSIPDMANIFWGDITEACVQDLTETYNTEFVANKC